MCYTVYKKSNYNMSEISANTYIPSELCIKHICKIMDLIITRRMNRYRFEDIQRILDVEVGTYMIYKCNNSNHMLRFGIYSHSKYEDNQCFDSDDLNEHDEEEENQDELYISEWEQETIPESMDANTKKDLKHGMIRRFLTKMTDTIDNLIIDNNRSKFTLPYFEGMSNKYLSNNPCSVCLEGTSTITNCRHFLCITCFSAMSEEIEWFACPICRENISYKSQYFGSSIKHYPKRILSS